MSWFRWQDVVWLVLFGALVWVSPLKNTGEIEMLAAMALLQITVPRVRALNTPTGTAVVIGVKLLISFLLIAVTKSTDSEYTLILFLPILSAATTYGALGTSLVTVLACATYLAMWPLAVVRWHHQFEPDDVQNILLRVLFFPLVAYLTYGLAESNRTEARRAQAAVQELAKANARLREAEASVRRGERLAALGQLSAGLAHELRNPLSTIRTSAELLVKRLEGSGSVAQELADYIASEVDRTNLLVTRFLEFARPLQLRLAELDVHALLDEAIQNFQRQDPSRSISVHRAYDPSVPAVEGDATLLERVFFNLIQNAADASPAEGVVTVKTRALDSAIEIAVIDRGSGILPEHREQVFNPFFTTKPSGVGLGLPIAAKIVDEHGGRLEVQSESGQGAAFVVRLALSPTTDRRTAGPQSL
ncbi:MAG: ATP-binding protein [Bryobacteraceae bacterium]|jgi:signal transduction histidine kinase